MGLRGECLQPWIASANQEDDMGGRKWKGYPEEETIPESDEPPPTPGFMGKSQAQKQSELDARNKRSRSSSRHRRESAEVS